MALINPAVLLDPPCEPGCPRKRRRLDNLTPEQRALRRKLKNRVAAQTARDRKKARMTELEESLALFEEENKKLTMENETLRKRTSKLEVENSELKSRLGLTPPSSPTCSEESATSSLPSPPRSPLDDEPVTVGVKQEIESPEYAELGVSQQKKLYQIPFLSLLALTVTFNLLSLTSYLAFLKTLSPTTQKTSFPSRPSQMTSSSFAPASLQTADKNETMKNSQEKWGREQNAWNPPAESL